MVGYATQAYEDMAIQCDNLEDFKNDVLRLLQNQRQMWQEKIEQILSENNLSCRQLAELCQVSEPTIRKWRKGAIPQNRDMYIRIGFAAGYDLAEMNMFLLRYGRCPQLYAKSLEDSICIFILTSENVPHTYQCYKQLLEQVSKELQYTDSGHRITYDTPQLHQKILDVNNWTEMVDFSRKNAASYREKFAKLYSYILAFLKINRMDRVLEKEVSVHSFAEDQQWSSSLRHCISDIRNKRWFPLRHKIISLGLHLNMDTEDINTMLQYAQMENLCAKNPVEATIIFAVEDAKLNDLICRDGSDDLRNHVKEILRQVELAEAEYLLDDL